MLVGQNKQLFEKKQFGHLLVRRKAMKRTSPLFEGLQGPCVSEAVQILRLASTFTDAQALALSDAWELDNDPDYMAYCSTIGKALESAGRALPLGWFEAYFADAKWLEGNKALHAVADAVMATLAKDLVAAPIVTALLAPWVMMMAGALEGAVDLKPRFLLNQEVICVS